MFETSLPKSLKYHAKGPLEPRHTILKYLLYIQTTSDKNIS